QYRASAQCAGLSSASSADIHGGSLASLVAFPSPARVSIPPAAAAVKAQDQLAMLGPDGGPRRPVGSLEAGEGRNRVSSLSSSPRYTLYRTGTKYRSGHSLNRGPLRNR